MRSAAETQPRRPVGRGVRCSLFHKKKKAGGAAAALTTTLAYWAQHSRKKRRTHSVLAAVGDIMFSEPQGQKGRSGRVSQETSFPAFFTGVPSIFLR